MTGVEFIRRFVQHLVPARLRRVRYTGLLGPRTRAEYLDQCRELLQDRAGPSEAPESLIDDESLEEEPREEAEIGPKSCPRCHSRDLIFIEHYRPEEHGQDVGGSNPVLVNTPAPFEAKVISP